MKKILLLVIKLTIYFRVEAQPAVDVLHYKFSIALNDNNDSIYGKAEIQVSVSKNVNNIRLDLVNTSQGKGMSVVNVQGNYISSYTHKDNKLNILLNRSTPKEDTLVFLVDYKGIPANGLIISKNKYGKRTFFGDNWPNRAHHWLPCVDDPADKASVEFIVTAPSHYQVVANGVLLEETNLPDKRKLTHWKEDVPLPTKVMVIGVAEFAVQNTGTMHDCIPVSSWVFPDNRVNGFYDYAIAKDVLAWYINYIGPYPYKKLANVQSKTLFGGMENASAIFYHEGSVSGNRSIEDLIAHEIVHQWFGNHATEKSFAHLWLSEGFATYLTHVYLEAKYGTDSLNKRMAEDREIVLNFVKNSKRPVVDTTSDYMRLLNANSYQKGSWVLHMLRRQLGDNVFHKSIRDYYALYAGKNAETKDLQKVFEHNSGKNLEKFFQQWLYTNVNPELELKWKYLPGQAKIELTVTQLQDGTVFELPLELLMFSEKDEPRLKKIHISKKSETFVLNAGKRVINIKPDPNVSLLFMEKIVRL